MIIKIMIILLWDRFGTFVIRLTFILAVTVFIIAPLQALAWQELPFPGFVVEHTLVVSSVQGKGWRGHAAGIDYPQHLVSVAERPVTNRAEYNAALSQFKAGQTIPVVTELPDHTRLVYPSVELVEFPLADMILLFWLPYGVGLVYLGIGLWVYRLRGNTRPGRAFAFLCAIAAIVIGTLFGLYSSRYSTYLWTLAIAETGSMVIAVSLLFPDEFSPARARDALRILIHLIGLTLTAWGIISLTNPQDPWAYIIPWRFSYVYAAIGILFFLGMLVFRQLSHRSAVTRQQARIILAGSLLAFAPVTLWLGAPMAGIFARWSPLIFLPLLLIFPLAFTVAIFRYHMWDIDIIIRRTLVYGTLTAILGLFYFISIVLLQRIFVRLTGEESSLAIVLSTLAIAALFNPLRQRIQAIIDRRFYRSRYDAQKILEAFAATLHDKVELEGLSASLLAVVEETLQPEAISLWMAQPERNVQR